MLNPFGKMLKGKKTPVQTSKTNIAPTKGKVPTHKGLTSPVSELVPPEKLGAQYQRQWRGLVELYRSFPCHPWNAELEQSLRHLLKSLQSHYFSDALLRTYAQDELKNYQTYASEAFEIMGQTNRARMESLLNLADEDMRKAIFESIFLFDLNPDPALPLILEEPYGFDETGHPLKRKYGYPVFQKNALTGVKGHSRFLPESINNDTSGMMPFLKGEYASRIAEFGKNEKPAITAITTIGSLGGIGHKPNSDIDAQVVFNTEPEYDFRWNDADFFIALIAQIFQQTCAAFWSEVLSEQHRKSITEKTLEDLRLKFKKSLSSEELKIIDSIFPSLYSHYRFKITLGYLGKLPPQQQIPLIYKQITTTLRKYPYFEKQSAQIFRFFPFLKKMAPEKFHTTCFPFSAKSLNTTMLSLAMAAFYQKEHLTENDAKRIILYTAKKYGVEPKQIPLNKRPALFLAHLTSSPKRNQVLTSFLHHFLEKISFEMIPKLNEMRPLFQQIFDPEGLIYNERIFKELPEKAKQRFRSTMVQLVEGYMNQEAAKNEAQSAFPLYQKAQIAEAYLTQKYPHTEIHYFINILRTLRLGQHTPFLVSPEGSQAYSSMLNDFLLNPAVFLCGCNPMPFDLPHDFKTLGTIGVIPAETFKLTQTGPGGGKEKFTLQQLSNWGEIDIPREKVLQHAIPIFLRESEKVSHRNLPKALLNCWWIEMICCLEDESTPPTSLTRLLFNPSERYFVKQNLEHPWVKVLKEMESQFSELVRDPWWLKFTEMLTRFQDPLLQKQIIFCFAQHIRISEVINYTDVEKTIWLDKNDKTISWRTWALARFYELFIPDKKDRMDLMKFTQGRDDIGNQMEDELKQAFVQSMQNVQKKILSLNHTRSLKAVSRYILSMKQGQTNKERMQKHLVNLLKIVNNTLVIADEKVMLKAKAEEALNSVEQMQLEVLTLDRKKVRQVSEEIVYFHEQFDMHLDVNRIEHDILHSRIKIAGDPLENFLFGYHFERNFKRKPYQVPLPIAKSLSIPRDQIMISFAPDNSQKWVFKSILNKKEARKVGGEGGFGMFVEHLVQGITRCVFSGYVGFDSRNLTSFQKPAVNSNSPVANNPITTQDIQTLAFDIHEFFEPFVTPSRELIENINYIRDIFMVCNVNRYNRISLIIRDNYEEEFVIDFDIDKIPVKVPPHLEAGGDKIFPEFYQRLNSKEARVSFTHALGQLNIPLLPEYQPRFRIWVNTGKFSLPVNPKHYRVYANGIAHALWPSETVGTTSFIKPVKSEHSFAYLGQQAVDGLHSKEKTKKHSDENYRKRAKTYLIEP
ncbi:hypothetical protein WDW89_11765 [Deltaproteobacteria bacterium TL4]